MNWLQRLIRFMVPHEEHFFDYIESAAKAADDAAKFFMELAQAESRDARLVFVERIRDAEHAGDKAKKDMGDALDTTFITPLDREDLFTLTGTLESVSDFISSTANHLTVHQMDTLPEGTRELSAVLLKATGQFLEATGYLRSNTNYEKIRALCASIHGLEHDADVIFRTRLGDLFANEKDAIQLIKHKEFLEGLENSVDRCASVATVLEAIIIKNG